MIQSRHEMQGISGMFQNVHSRAQPGAAKRSNCISSPTCHVKCWKKCQAFKKLKNQRKNAVIPKTTDHLKPTLLSVFKKKTQSQHRKKHTKLLGLSGNPSQVLDWMDKSCKLEGHSHLMMQAQGPPDFMMKLFQNVEKNNKNTNNKKKHVSPAWTCPVPTKRNISGGENSWHVISSHVWIHQHLLVACGKIWPRFQRSNAGCAANLVKLQWPQGKSQLVRKHP